MVEANLKYSTILLLRPFHSLIIIKDMNQN